MSDSLTLLTSDDPPVLLTASRTALAANSKVFADMLSVPACDKASEPVVVAETQEQIEPFLRLLEGQAPTLSSPQWEVLARLGDKYDSFFVQQAADARAWELEAKDEEALHAFTLATTTGNKDLLDRSALRAIRVSDRSTLGADQEWRDRLDAPDRIELVQDNFEARRIAKAWRLVTALSSSMVLDTSRPCCCGKWVCCQELQAIVPTALHKFVQSLEPSAGRLALWLLFEPASREGSCVTTTYKRLCDGVEHEWATSAPQFSQIRWSVHDVSTLLVDLD